MTESIPANELTLARVALSPDATVELSPRQQNAVRAIEARNGNARGPRNLPKPDSRKQKRRVAKAARKVNRGVYSGQ